MMLKWFESFAPWFIFIFLGPLRILAFYEIGEMLFFIVLNKCWLTSDTVVYAFNNLEKKST